MIGGLAAYIAMVFGDALAYTLSLLVAYVLILTIRRNLHTVLRWYDNRD